LFELEAMLKDHNKTFRVGEWVVRPDLNSLSRDGVEQHLEPKVMLVLLALAAQPNRVISKEDLIAAVWPDTFVGDDVLTRCISILRRVTEDDAHAPHFVQTIPKVGYRLVASVVEVETPAEEKEPAPLPILASALPIASAPVPSPVSRQGTRGWVLPVFFLVLIGMVAGWFWFRHWKRSTAQAPASFRIVQFTSSAGEQTQPAFSPDGRRIAFVLIPENGASRRIYIKQIGNETLQPLTDSEDEQFSPAWSPDGRQIAYLSRSANGLGIFIATPGEANRVRKVFIPEEPSHWEQGALSWSPDGKSLVFPDHSGMQPNSSIYQLNVQTGEAHSITSPPPGWEGDLNPAWSPDGKKVAFTRASETAVRDIYWISLADGQVHQLTHDRMDIDSLTWSADSASVVFSSNREGKYALWKMGLARGAAERLSVGTEDAYQPAVGPKPGELAYTQGATVWNIVRLQPGARDAASKITVVLSSTQQDSAPSLSPDGKFFAIQSLRSGAQEIWISSIRGDALRQLTFMGGPLTGSPAWSHHGNEILFDSRPDGHSHIFMISASGGQPKQITFGNNNDIVPRWSHDDRTIYFRSNRGDRWQIWKVAANGGTAQPVTSLDGIVPQESPDGKYLYYTRGDEDGLWRVSTDGSPETQMLQQPSANYWGYWEITPQGLFYLDRTQSTASIRILNPDTRQSSTFITLPHSPPPFAGISVADEGRLVLMTDEQRNSGRHITLVEPQG
jgi:Tol biopolymer transport system component/DNA-binding winged helix-turn-helix (wHTH) protein